MKRKKNVEELWVKPLREQLLTVKPLPLIAKSKDGLKISERAVGEIVSGVRFCQERELKVSVTLRRCFDIGNFCQCLLALNDESHEYQAALKVLGISAQQAEKIGCCQDMIVDDYIFNAMGFEETWQSLYNRLWRSTGRFFKAHPEFGVK